MTTPEQKLVHQLIRFSQYFATEWDLTAMQVVGCMEVAKLELWNTWEDFDAQRSGDIDDLDDDD